MKKNRENRHKLSDSERDYFGFNVTKEKRYRLSEKQFVELRNMRSLKKTLPPKQDDPSPFVLSAWNFDTGKMMDIDEYCAHYNLPREDIIEYKLITHTGTPYYNTKFKDKGLTNNELDFKTIISDTCSKVMIDYNKSYHSVKESNSSKFDRLIYTDTHVGMDTNKSGKAMYAIEWNEDELFSRLEWMVDAVLAEQTGDELIIQDLGDFMDGFNGETTRGGHKLPQNMSNQEAYDVGVRFKIAMTDMLTPHYDRIVCSNICNDNHAGSFGHIVNSGFKNIVDIKYSNVFVYNHDKFINHYFIGDHCFVVSHGKDDTQLKFGFKPQLDPKQIEKIDQYMKRNGIYNKAKYIEFSKGDSHQALFDYCSSDDFDYCNYPAFSPSSEWVQTNFKKGRSGFVIQSIEYNSNYKKTTPYFF